MIEDAEQKASWVTWLSYHRTDKRQHRCRSCMGSVRKGYKAVLTMPETNEFGAPNLIKSHGAELVLTPATKEMSGVIKKRKSKLRDNTPEQSFRSNLKIQQTPPTILWLQQRIWQDTDGKADVFILEESETGGNIKQVRWRTEINTIPISKIAAAEPDSSRVAAKTGYA